MINESHVKGHDKKRNRPIPIAIPTTSPMHNSNFKTKQYNKDLPSSNQHDQQPAKNSEIEDENVNDESQSEDYSGQFEKEEMTRNKGSPN